MAPLFINILALSKLIAEFFCGVVRELINEHTLE
jgi:hypothetical protein